jgi:BirA family transcriptional regulator, biotin operon repressor / biotin---[acetyl-CoA-carboxylase] ligase
MPGTLAPESVVPLLRGRLGRPYVYAESCDSTQRLLLAEHPEGAAAVCEEQLAGRGRLGRTWEAPASSSILCSILLRPPGWLPVAQLSLVGGLAVADTVEKASGQVTAIKWPNDVLLDGGKVAGVLAEGRPDRVVLGLGLNVNQTGDALPPRPGIPATSLRAVDGVERDRAPMLADLLAFLEARYDAWSAGGLAVLHGELAARDALRGRRVRAGHRSGVALGIDRDGRLELSTTDGTIAIASGEVSIESVSG